MNNELLRIAGEHVQREHANLRDLNGALESALALALDAYLDEKPVEQLPGTPPADRTDRLAWLDYFVGQGALVFHEQLPLEEV